MSIPQPGAANSLNSKGLSGICCNEAPEIGLIGNTVPPGAAPLGPRRHARFAKQIEVGVRTVQVSDLHCTAK